MNINLDLTQVLITVLTLVLSWGLKKGSDWLDAKAATEKQKSQHEKLDKYIDFAVKAIEDAVAATNITVVNDLKNAAADGKLTKEEAKGILDDTVTHILGVLSEDSRDVLSMIYGDLPAWIQNKVINAVEAAKGTTGVGVVVTGVLTDTGTIVDDSNVTEDTPQP